MFDLNQFPTILQHLHSISNRFHTHNNYLELFCPYCDDATRKINPNHGHFNISITFPFGKCFRCGTKVSLERLLLDTGFNDLKILERIRRSNSGFTYHHLSNINSNDLINRNQLIEYIQNFSQNHQEYYKLYQQYIYKRCLDIIPINFLLLPIIEQQNNNLLIRILNYNNKIVTNRLVTYNNIRDKSFRYLNPTGERFFYYFQDIDSLIDYESIVVCEGAFDLVNLYNYSNIFNKDKSFYIAIGGSNYKGAIDQIINNYLLIGKYSINIVFDNGLMSINKIMDSIKYGVTNLNPEIILNFYFPVISKDVSELMSIEKRGK